MYSNPNMFKDWIVNQLNFNEYSALNKMYLFAQNPNATYVASYTKWKALGYPVVKKGAMKVLCPIFNKGFIDYNDKWKPLSKATEEETEDIKSGKLKTKAFIRDYRLANVFDISCTEATEKDLVKKISKKTVNLGNNLSTEEIINKLVEYTNINNESKDLNERLYNIVREYIQNLINDEMDIEDQTKQKVLTEACTFGILSQMQVDTSLLTFEVLNHLNYEDDYKQLMQMNNMICNGIQYAVEDLSSAFI